MKKIIITIVLITGVLQILKSAPWNFFTPTIVYTCKNGQIEAGVLAVSDLSTSQKAAAKAELLDPNNSQFGFLGIQSSDIISDATYSYNCHAYAWHLTEGNSNNVWINDYKQSGANNLSTYWDPSVGCFYEVFSESDADKIYYYVGYHSAVKSSVSGKYESKWGDYPVVRHNPTKVPTSYQSNYLKFYKRKVFISGPILICTGSPQTFSSTYWQSGYTWDKSSNLNISGSGSSVTVSKSGSDGPGWVSLKSGGVELARKDVWVGIPFIGSFINGPSTVTNSQINTFSITSPLLHSSFNFSWSATGGYYGVSSTYNSGNTNYGEIYFSPPGSRTLQVYASNSCGSCSPVYLGITVTGGSDTLKSAVFPNPATDIIYIDVDRKMESLFDAPLPPTTSCDIRLYDANGILRRQTKTYTRTTQLNVFDLPKGIYFLHIYYDGLNSKPEIQKILITR